MIMKNVKKKKLSNKEKKSIRRENERKRQILFAERNEELIKERNKKMCVANNNPYLCNTYGCDTVKSEEQTPYVNKLLIDMKLPNPIKVPQRKRGLTSSGKELRCHSNVYHLVHLYGGKRMLGYMVQRDERGSVGLFSHSVWITPEKKVVDVTKKNKRQTSSFIDKKDLDNQWFIPMEEISDKYANLKDISLPKKYEKVGYYTTNCDTGDTGWDKSRWNNPTPKDFLSYGRRVPLEEIEDVRKKHPELPKLEVMIEDKKNEIESFFSEPSLFTGRKPSVDVSTINSVLVEKSNGDYLVF